jgi:hypothetical protein
VASLRPLSALLAVALAALLGLPGVADAARRPAAPALPTVTGVAPLKLGIGDLLTVRGTGFRPGRLRNTVVFRRDGHRAVFVRAEEATRTRIRVRVPAKLEPFLARTRAGAVPTRFRVRVLARRFAARFTRDRLSPVIGLANRTPPGGGGGGPAPEPDCDADGRPNGVDDDDDGDLLSDALDLALKLDPCKRDTDGDRLEDGWEYEAALDLNVRALPYPGKRPYPNPLDPADAGVDHDGDGLESELEHAAWMRYGNRALPLSYSDGTQVSGGPLRAPGTPALAHLDLDGDGWLTDDEKDVDGDRLTNYDETHGPLLQSFWPAKHGEAAYPLDFLEPDWLDRDTDGDTVGDAEDDQDHDDVANLVELERGAAWPDVTGRWRHPYNPCLPNPTARTCMRHIPFGVAFPPFDARYNNTPALPLRKWYLDGVSGGEVFVAPR